MIDKLEIIDVATAQSLRPDVVEKDYALGWVLAGIGQHPELRESWIFKGGTCLKKCFFETYRFSEDLDFTLLDESHLNNEFLGNVFDEISEWIYDTCGLELPNSLHKFDLFTNPRGHSACQGKVAYRGPISPQSERQLPRVKLDLSADERLVLPPHRLQIYHPYSDVPDTGIEVLSYAYEEAFGEKVRALGERTRPRDLYDVVNLFRNEDARPAAAVLLDVLKQKCAYKQISIPDMKAIAPHKPDLEGAWQPMLGHQLPALPNLENFWSALPDFFEWLVGGTVPLAPQAYRLSAGETILRERTLSLPVGLSSQSHIEIIRFAATNRLCVDIDYDPLNGRRGVRRVEPYSLRRTSEGEIILHIEKTGANEHRTYRVDRIRGVEVTNETFVPRHRIELSPDQSLRIPDSSRPTSVPSRQSAFSRPRVVRSNPLGGWVTSRRGSPALSGPTYVFECTSCGKKFRRKAHDSSLKAHKDKSGYPCYGRIGVLVDTKY